MNEPTGRRGKRGKGRRAAAAGGDEDVVAWIAETAAEAAEFVRAGARAAGRQIEQSAGEMTHAAVAAVRDAAGKVYEQQKGRAVARVELAGTLAEQSARALRAVKADQVATYIEQASRRVAEATDYLEDRTLTQMIQDAGAVVRRHQAVAVGGMLVAGFALSRFFKASAARAAAVDGREAGEAREGKKKKKKKKHADREAVAADGANGHARRRR